MAKYYFEFQSPDANGKNGTSWSEFAVEAETEIIAWREANRLKPREFTLRPKRVSPAGG